MISQQALAGTAPTRPILMLCVLLVGTAVAVPCGTLIWESLSAQSAQGAAFSLTHYAKVLSSPASYRLLLNTVGFSATMTVVAGSLGFFFAWIAARTNVPLRSPMPVAILLPYLVPPMLGAISWILLLSPRNGIINQAFAPLVGAPIFNIYSFAGMVFVESLYTFPLSFTFFYATLITLDPVLEEASAVAGASTLRTLRYTTLPSMWPSIISVATLLFIIGLESFDVAWFLGYPAKIYTLSIEVFLLTRYEYPPDVGAAAVYGVIALVAAMLMVAVYRRITREQGRFVAIGGKAYRPGGLDIGRMRWPACILFYGLVAIIGVLPILLLLGISLGAVTWPFRVRPHLSVENFVWIISDSESLRALTNTALLAVLGALSVVSLGFIIAYVSTRTRERGHAILDYLSFLPFGFPSTVLAVGIIGALIHTPLYNTLWIMLLAFALKFLPYGLRSISNSMLQVHRELEEASFASGAGLFTTLHRVMLPLTAPGLIAAWSLLFIVFGRQFSLPIMM